MRHGYHGFAPPSIRLVTLIQLVIPFDQLVVSSLYKDLVIPQRSKFFERL